MTVHTAPKLDPGSWVHDMADGPEFVQALQYASMQTRFIIATSGMTAEQVYAIWSPLHRGALKPRRPEEQP
jgi:hypothetical protein